MHAGARTPLLAAEGLTKSFGGARAVDRVDLAVDAGEALGVAGPNGSGKSTLFNILTNVPFRADAGKVRLEGVEIQTLAPHLVARRGLARTFQRESVFPGLSAIDNAIVAVEAIDRSGSMRERERRAEEALDFVGFPATLHNAIAGGLPVFLRKLAMIGSAMALRPKALLLDEPASGLTPDEIDRIRELILKLKASGVAILLVEHVLHLLAAVSDRLMVLDQGRVIAAGAPAETIANPRVVEAYLGGAL